ncbi:MAG: MBL fold metallo-hydrolase [Lentilitoribacter sp.]
MPRSLSTSIYSFAITATLSATLSTAQADELLIHNLRVGQGDATLIQGPIQADGSRVNVLVDAGDIPKRDGGDIIRAVLWKKKVKKLDYLIITHDDADHLGGIAYGGVHGESFLLGFNDVPGDEGDDDGDGIVDWIKGAPDYIPDPDEMGKDDDVEVKFFVDYGEHNMRGTTQAIKKYNRFANSMGTRITLESQNDADNFEINLGSDARMILFATNGYVRGLSQRVANVDRPNEKSLSFLVTYGDFDYLISGDLIGREHGREDAKVEEAVGQAIVDEGFNVDVLHVNHHGANNASSKAFLDIIKPEIAIISAGNRNDHKHPDIETLERLVEAGVDRIFQTSWGTTRSKFPYEIRDHHAIWQQDITIRSNGKKFWLETSRDWKAE